MHRIALFGVSLFLGHICPAFAQTQEPPCKFTPFSGASAPQGAIVNVTMRNNGRLCAIPNFGLPAERANPADSGRVTKDPANGQAAFVPPSATYLPAAGFVGADEFQYEAWATGRSGKQVRLHVTVKVHVEQP